MAFLLPDNPGLRPRSTKPYVEWAGYRYVPTGEHRNPRRGDYIRCGERVVEVLLPSVQVHVILRCVGSIQREASR